MGQDARVGWSGSRWWLVGEVAGLCGAGRGCVDADADASAVAAAEADVADAAVVQDGVVAELGGSGEDLGAGFGPHVAAVEAVWALGEHERDGVLAGGQRWLWPGVLVVEDEFVAGGGPVGGGVAWRRHRSCRVRAPQAPVGGVGAQPVAQPGRVPGEAGAFGVDVGQPFLGDLFVGAQPGEFVEGFP